MKYGFRRQLIKIFILTVVIGVIAFAAKAQTAAPELTDDALIGQLFRANVQLTRQIQNLQARISELERKLAETAKPQEDGK